MILLYGLFFVAIAAIAWTYVLYPWWMKIRARAGRSFEPLESPCSVAVLVAVYNEEAVLEEKIRSTLDTDYPAGMIRLYIGSDASIDRTDEIARSWSQKDARVYFRRFESRTGKPEIINQLAALCDAEWLILTDADTFFRRDTIGELCRPFADTRVGGVQARFVSRATAGSNVAAAELSYNDREISIKRGQSVDGAVIGAYGACYAIRRSLYEPVPPGFLVDDFYIFMKVLEKGHATVLAEDAVCTLEISGASNVEFRRKARIGAGNYTNLMALRAFWWPVGGRAALYYWSYKVLRWLTPFFLILILASNIGLALHSRGWADVLWLQLVMYLLLCLDFLLQAANLSTGPLRFGSHFLRMNLALLVGFFRFLRGGRVGIWR